MNSTDKKGILLAVILLLVVVALFVYAHKGMAHKKYIKLTPAVECLLYGQSCDQVPQCFDCKSI